MKRQAYNRHSRVYHGEALAKTEGGDPVLCSRIFKSMQKMLKSIMLLLMLIVSINFAQGCFAEFEDESPQEEQNEVSAEVASEELRNKYEGLIRGVLNIGKNVKITKIMLVHHKQPLFHEQSFWGGGTGESSFVVYTDIGGEHVLRANSYIERSESNEYGKQYRDFYKKNFSQISKGDFDDLQKARNKLNSELSDTTTKFNDNFKSKAHSFLERIKESNGNISDFLEELKEFPVQIIEEIKQKISKAKTNNEANVYNAILQIREASETKKTTPEELKYDNLVILSKKIKELKKESQKNNALIGEINQLELKRQEEVKKLSDSEVTNLNTKRPGFFSSDYVKDLWEAIDRKPILSPNAETKDSEVKPKDRVKQSNDQSTDTPTIDAQPQQPDGDQSKQNDPRAHTSEIGRPSWLQILPDEHKQPETQLLKQTEHTDSKKKPRQEFTDKTTGKDSPKSAVDSQKQEQKSSKSSVRSSSKKTFWNLFDIRNEITRMIKREKDLRKLKKSKKKGKKKAK